VRNAQKRQANSGVPILTRVAPTPKTTQTIAFLMRPPLLPRLQAPVTASAELPSKISIDVYKLHKSDGMRSGICKMIALIALKMIGESFRALR
jgi:hypothetical protein